jgi:hypothetical protein
LVVAGALWLLYVIFSGGDQSQNSRLSPQQASALNDRLAKAGLLIRYSGPMSGMSGRDGILLYDETDMVRTPEAAETVRRVVGDFLNDNAIEGFGFVAVMGSHAKTRTMDLPPRGAALRHYSYACLSFDYPSYMTVPDKEKSDVDKVRDMVRRSGVEILTVLMSPDMNTTVQVARTKREIPMAALYQEKKSLADRISKSGVNIMGDEFSKFTVEKGELSGVPALFEYGEKANGQVAVTLEFVEGGYDYALIFIYKDRSHAQSGADHRESVVRSIKIKSSN